MGVSSLILRVCVCRSRRGAAGKTARTTNPNGPVLTHTHTHTHRGKEIKREPIGPIFPISRPSWRHSTPLSLSSTWCVQWASLLLLRTQFAYGLGPFFTLTKKSCMQVPWTKSNFQNKNTTITRNCPPRQQPRNFPPLYLSAGRFKEGWTSRGFWPSLTCLTIFPSIIS